MQMKPDPRRAPLWAAALCLGAAAPAAAVQETMRVERTIEVEAGTAVSVMNFAGQVAVRSAATEDRLLRFVAVKRLQPGVPPEESERHFRRVNLDLHQTEGHVRIGPQPPRGADGRTREIPLTEVRAPRRIPPVLVDLELWLPEGLSLTVRSFTAAISLEDVASPGGRFLLRSISGPLEVNGLVADHVVAETVSGEMRLEDVAARRCTAETLTANIRLAGALREDGWYEVRTHSGEVDLGFGAVPGFLLDASTFRGEIVSDFPMEPTPSTPLTLAGRHGDSGPEVTVSTFSSPIRLLAGGGPSQRTAR